MTSCRFLAALALAAALQQGAGQTYRTSWWWRCDHTPAWSGTQALNGKYLTTNNGAHAVAVRGYDDDGWKYRVIVGVALEDTSTQHIRTLEYDDLSAAAHRTTPYDDGYWNNGTRNACVAITGPNGNKHVACAQTGIYWKQVWSASDAFLVHMSPWNDYRYHSGEISHESYLAYVTAQTQTSGEDEWVYVAYVDVVQQGQSPLYSLYLSRSSDDGVNWLDNVQVHYSNALFESPSLGVSGTSDLYLAYYRDYDGHIYFDKSTNNGTDWLNDPMDLTEFDDAVERPCLAADGDDVFVCWTQEDAEKGIVGICYRWSTDGGNTWTPDLGSDPKWVNFPATGEDREYRTANTAMLRVNIGGYDLPAILLACESYFYGDGINPEATQPVTWWAYFDGASWRWNPTSYVKLRYRAMANDDCRVNPAVAATADSHDTVAVCVWSDTSAPPYCQPISRQLWRATARWYRRELPPAPVYGGPGRNVALKPNGSCRFAYPHGPYVVAGPITRRYPVPGLVDDGRDPALACDVGGNSWVSYVRADTVWCLMGESDFKVVFAGSSTARPGQPSVACYPNQVDGGYVGAVVFPV